MHTCVWVYSCLPALCFSLYSIYHPVIFPPLCFCGTHGAVESQWAWAKVNSQSTANTTVIARCPPGVSLGRQAEECIVEGERKGGLFEHKCERKDSKVTVQQQQKQQRVVQRQTAPTTVSHRGRPVTRLHTVASQSAGQTGGWLRADNVYDRAGHGAHMGAAAAAHCKTIHTYLPRYVLVIWSHHSRHHRSPAGQIAQFVTFLFCVFKGAVHPK